MLTGKIALVTGAGRGIGREIALVLAANGATVIVNYNGSKESAEAVVAEIVQDGGSAEAMQCNVADFAACAQMIETIIQKSGRLDILVNNAGITKDGLLMKMSDIFLRFPDHPDKLRVHAVISIPDILVRNPDILGIQLKLIEFFCVFKKCAISIGLYLFNDFPDCDFILGIMAGASLQKVI